MKIRWWVVSHKKNPFLCGCPPPKQWGWGNGYIALSPKHPWYKMNYNEIDGVHVHGDLTYSEMHAGKWVIGFDTGHFYSKSMTREKVIEETKKLKQQAIGYYEAFAKIDLSEILKLSSI